MKKTLLLPIVIICLLSASFDRAGCARKAHKADAAESISMWKAKRIDTAHADFAYRTVYSYGNSMEPSSRRMGLGSLNYDWGLWGHNLRRVLPKKPSREVFARTKGEVNPDQFCFSSHKLWDYTMNYIEEHYGTDQSTDFLIMPNDNPFSCTCEQCRKKGNTSTNATPAVTEFISRLAERFPQHRFFTSYYYSTAFFPQRLLPRNMGVIISAIEMPLARGSAAASRTVEFCNLIDKWKLLAPHVFVWDYCRNFDDYLTPFPCLHILQERLRMYKEHGVEGIVLNGSGEDYSTFDELQTWVLANLMVDVDKDVDTLVDVFFQTYYPKSGHIIRKYYNTLEAKTRCLGLYEGIGYAVGEYLDPEEFILFVDELERASKNTEKPERDYLNYLLTGLNFTRLELLRLTNDPQLRIQKADFIANLRGHSVLNAMQKFREVDGDIDEYLEYVNWHKGYEVSCNNVLHDTRLTTTSQLDEGAPPIGVLNDGFFGIPYDYHTHWMLYSGDTLHITIPAIGKPLGDLRVGLLVSSRWHIGNAKVVAVQGTRKTEMLPMLNLDKKYERVEAKLSMESMDPTDPIELYLIKTGRKIAIDEITLCAG